MSLSRSLFVVPLSLLLLFMPFISNAADSKTIVLDVPGMTCKFCPITIRKALKKVPGVTDVKAEFESKTATVTFDPSKTDVETLIKTTANSGYPSSLKKN